jgi:plastocyanin
VRGSTLGRALLLGAALVFCPNLTAAGKAQKVAMEGIKFVPERLEVALGDTITWTNRDLVPHTVTSGTAIESGTIDANKHWQYVARKKGEIDYICRFHPGMRGKLIVK